MNRWIALVYNDRFTSNTIYECEEASVGSTTPHKVILPKKAKKGNQVPPVFVPMKAKFQLIEYFFNYEK